MADFTGATLQSAADATGNGTALRVIGYSSASFQVTGTFVGTVTFEATVDDTNWVSLLVANVADGVTGTTTTTTGIYTSGVAGLLKVRARVSAYTSGSITVQGYTTPAAAGSVSNAVISGDVEIGAVEIKNATTDTRAIVLAASTAAAATDTPLVVALHPSSPLGAGTAAIGKLAANSGVDIGDVDVTSVIPGTGATNLGKAVDGVAGATDTGIAPVAVRDDALSALTPIEGDYVPLRVDANGALWASVSAALPAGTNAIGKLAANSGVDIGDVDITSVTPGTTAALLGKAEDAVAGSGDTGVFALGVANEAQTALAADGDYIAQGTDTKGNRLTVGNIAHDGVDAGYPLKVGAKAIASLATATLVAGADRTDAQSDLDGAVIVRDQFPLGDLKSEAVSNTDGASTAFTNFSAVASTKNYITGAHVFNTSATAGYVDFRDGTAGSVLYRMYLPATGGSILPASSTPYFKTSANTALAFDVSAALTTVYISISGFQSKVA